MELYYKLVWVKGFFGWLFLSFFTVGVPLAFLATLVARLGLLYVIYIAGVCCGVVCIVISIAMANKAVYDKRRENGEKHWRKETRGNREEGKSW